MYRDDVILSLPTLSLTHTYAHKSSSSSNVGVGQDRIARREPRNCSCRTAKLGGIRTNGIHSDSLIRPSRATYNYSVYTIKPHRFPRGHAHSPGKTQSLDYVTAIATHSPPRPSRPSHKRNLVIASYPPSSYKGVHVNRIIDILFPLANARPQPLLTNEISKLFV